ncbi:MAG: hypothetical protein J6P44_02485 [Bacteroidales bacterium]|nr:hypothetical protein [Bacteroidales bacterium]
MGSDIIKKISHCLIFILIAMFCVEYCSNKTLKEENQRLSNNQTALTQKMAEYTDKEGRLVAQVQSLSVSKGEFMRIASDEAEEVKDLKIQLKRLQSYSESGMLTEYRIDTLRLYDSIFIRDSIIDTVRCISYSDNWLRLQGCIEDDRYTGEIRSFDTLIQVVERIPKKFLFIKYGTKGFRQSVKSKNPHSRIVYSEHIQIK